MFELFDFKGLLLVVLVFVPLERLLPLHGDQRILRRHWSNDLLYVVLNGFLIRLGLLAIVVTAATVSDSIIPVGFKRQVAAQPFLLQTAEILLLADLGFYAVHRAFHTVPWLWRFHVIHHSIEEMDWLAAHRVHPVDQILTKGVSLIPCFALGFSGAAIGAFALLYHWQALLIHSNTRVRFGPMKWILASPEFHHWHHANHEEAIDRNFAGQLPFLDWIFGTMFMPKDRMPDKYGVDEQVPTFYPAQLTHPFVASKPSFGQRSNERTAVVDAAVDAAVNAPKTT